MSRCAICDYLQGHGSELHDIPNRWNKRVKWREQHQEFQCEDCFAEIKLINNENYNRYESDTLLSQDKPEQEDSILPPALPPLPIK